MRTVWKYPIMTESSLELRREMGEPLDEVDLRMPRGARILHVQTQYGWPVLWADVYPSEPEVHRRFVIVGTGHPVPETAEEYVGTWLQHSDGLVFHLYEVRTDD